MSEPAIRVRGLRKSYGDVEAVAGMDLDVQRGEVVALLGPNGAGKTTTVEVLEGHRQRDSGDVSVLGYDPARNERSYKQRIGIVYQTISLERYLRVEEVIGLFRGYYPHPRPLDEIIATVGLQEQRHTLVRRLSGGQQRRLDVAIGLAGDPDLLFLDEPTTGFDPAARRGAWDMIRGLRSLGKTVLLTTHYIDEAQHLADRVAIIARGQIIAEGAPRELVRRDRQTTITFHPPVDPKDLPDAVRSSAVFQNGLATVRTTEPTRTLHELTNWATQRGIELEGLTVSPSSLEDVYLQLVGESPTEAAQE